MPEFSESTFSALESVIATWNAHVNTAFSDISPRLESVQNQLTTLIESLRLKRTISPLLILARLQLDAVVQSPQERLSKFKTMRRQVISLEDKLKRFVDVIVELDTHLQNTMDLGVQLQDALNFLHSNTAPDISRQESRVVSTSALGKQLKTLQEEVERFYEQFAMLQCLDSEEEIPHETESAVFSDSQKNAQDATEVAAMQEEGLTPTGHRIGDILLRQQRVTPDQLEMALRRQRQIRRCPIGAILREMGCITERHVAQALAEQMELPYLSPDQFRFSMTTVQLISELLARRYICIPIDKDAETLTVAMANPLDLIALDDLRLVTQRDIRPVIACESDIKSALDTYYD